MDTVLFFFYAAAYLVLLAWGVLLARRHGWRTASNVVLLVAAGLVYDNLVLATGRYVGEGQVLESLNAARFWLHALLTPLLVLFAWSTLVRAGVGWARRSWTLYGALALTAALVLLELTTQVLDLSLQPTRDYGVLSYESADTGGGPPLMVLVVSAVLLLAAAVVWRTQGWPWYFVGTAVMVVGSAVPIPVDSGAATNAFELILITSLLVTKRHQDVRVQERVPVRNQGFPG